MTDTAALAVRIYNDSRNLADAEKFAMTENAILRLLVMCAQHLVASWEVEDVSQTMDAEENLIKVVALYEKQKRAR